MNQLFFIEYDMDEQKYLVRAADADEAVRVFLADRAAAGDELDQDLVLVYPVRFRKSGVALLASQIEEE